ncbi:CD225/dispanin family protein [Corynebacterium freiburgense]|nr:CD225/dispanin family protein [Corynebacterium freiburgense]WJZ03950.1 Interferon-induced transmembrane protein [Corynebacterium freiburgense]
MTNPYNPYDPNAQQPQFNQNFGAGMPGGMPGNGMMKPENYLIFTILSTIMCCLPLGAIGIYYSLQVDKCWEQGRVADAEAAGKKAKNFAIASCVSIVIFMVIYFIFIALVGFAGVASETGSSY